eukprot:9497045-Pyramimonas_sp.AAC.1
MRGQADTRLKNTTVGMLRKRCCCEMGWWGYAKRKEFLLVILVDLLLRDQVHSRRLPQERGDLHGHEVVLSVDILPVRLHLQEFHAIHLVQ